MALGTSAGMIDQLQVLWPEKVQENWAERLHNLVAQMQAEIEEIHEFGGAFDGE